MRIRIELGGTGISPPDKNPPGQKTPGEKVLSGDIFYCSGSRQLNHSSCVCGLCGSVDGGWSDWSEWTSCSRSCGTGAMTRSRQCDSPPPHHGGRDCQGAATEETVCNLFPCPGQSALNPIITTIEVDNMHILLIFICLGITSTEVKQEEQRVAVGLGNAHFISIQQASSDAATLLCDTCPSLLLALL